LNIIIIRFSALGDVALSSPVISSLLKNNPALNIWFVSKKNMSDLFINHDRFHFIAADLHGRHKGLLGLKKLTNDIFKQVNPDTIVDLHDVIRTKIIKLFFKFRGIETITFEKGRKEKMDLIKGQIPFKPLPHITKRYLTAFKPILNDIQLNDGPYIETQDPLSFSFKSTKTYIGIAPFAAHKSKEWGLDKIEQLIKQLSNYELLFFGAGKQEIDLLNNQFKAHDHCHVIAGKYTLKEELNIMSKLKLMISMDSGNMHLATLANIPVISIWGPTHPFLGFSPLNNEKNIVQISKAALPCRPCSIYGKISNKKAASCAKVSLEKISVNDVLKKINTIIKVPCK